MRGRRGIPSMYPIPARWKRAASPFCFPNRVYRSIFGDFELSRYLYGKDPSQKALLIPFDEHFGLPPNRFSLLLESWVSQLSTSEAIHEAIAFSVSESQSIVPECKKGECKKGTQIFSNERE